MNSRNTTYKGEGSLERERTKKRKGRKAFIKYIGEIFINNDYKLM
jgi:hypothetical protein